MREKFKKELGQIKVDPEMRKRVLSKLEKSQSEYNIKLDNEHKKDVNVYTIQMKEHKKPLHRRVGLAAGILLGMVVVGGGIYQVYGNHGYGDGGSVGKAGETLQPTNTADPTMNVDDIFIDYAEVKYTGEDLQNCISRLKNRKWSENDDKAELVYLSDTVAVVATKSVIVIYNMETKEPVTVIDSDYYEKIYGERQYFETVLVDSEGKEVYIESVMDSGSDITERHIFNIEKQSFRPVVKTSMDGQFATQVKTNEDNKLHYFVERELWIPTVYVEPEKDVYYFAYGHYNFSDMAVIKYDFNKTDADGRIEQTIYHIADNDNVETNMIYNRSEQENTLTWSKSNLSEKELEDTKEMALEYYSGKEAYYGTVEKCEVNEETNMYNQYFDSTDLSDIVIYDVYFKDSENPPRLIVLRRENKNSGWDIVNEGY